MFTVSNALSFLRGPLALLFLIDRIDIRACIVIIAMLTDCIDGYLARRYKYVTRLGTILDPLMDKFFVFFVLTILFHEGAFQPWQIAAMLSRDIALLIFGTYLLCSGSFKAYAYRSIKSGKVTTALQFITLFFTSLHIFLPDAFFYLFFGCGLLALVELFATQRASATK